jgi:hypothetical protein
MTFRIIAALSLISSLALAGCVDKQVFFHNPNNAQLIGSCKAAGWGLIPMIMELSTEQDCETYYVNHGYIRD